VAPASPADKAGVEMSPIFLSHGSWSLFFSLQNVLDAAGIPNRVVWPKYAPAALLVPQSELQRAREALLSYWSEC
jgi:hypothetical protein